MALYQLTLTFLLSILILYLTGCFVTATEIKRETEIDREGEQKRDVEVRTRILRLRVGRGRFKRQIVLGSIVRRKVVGS
ncbi:hypothetical protein IFR05_009058 [Cadophora sp. M221]|nr:hypothetical protein IFR05_009058 [Cadophora sp. M221]